MDPDAEEYIGDAVFVSFDGYQIWLRTGDHNHQRIALEPPVFAKLVDYQKRLMDYYKAQQQEKTT